MSSYHSSFTYNGINSARDKGLMIASFEPDNGFKDSFLSMDNISDSYYDGTKRFDYGSKYNSSPEIQITVVKQDGSDMTLNEFRQYAKWLTGARINSWLDMYVGRTIVYSFLGKFINLEQYKLDGRTVGCRLTFLSVSPWAYSAPQGFTCPIWQVLNMDDDGIVSMSSKDNKWTLGYNNGILSANNKDSDSSFSVDNNGVAYLDNSYTTTIKNQSDDLYTYIYLDIEYQNEKSTFLSIKNVTLDEESRITGILNNELISISAKQFIISDSGRIFGDDFNFVWPRLAPGGNDLVIEGNGSGFAQFTYRFPMKVGDCTMDVNEHDNCVY